MEQIIRTQKFEGAAAELLNPNIIARDLGLADRSEHSGPGGGPIRTLDLSKLSDEALAEMMAVADAQKDSSADD